MSYRQGQRRTRATTGKDRLQARTGKDRLWARMGKDRLWARTGRDKDGLGQQELDTNLSRRVLGLDAQIRKVQLQSEHMYLIQANLDYKWYSLGKRNILPANLDYKWLWS